MDWRSKLLHADPAPAGYHSLAPSTHRASTTILPSMPATANASWREPYSYGLYGTPTTLDLAQRLASLCGGSRTFIVPSGQAGIALIDLALLKSGDHVLLPHNVYGTSSDLAEAMLTPLGIECTAYDPMQSIAAHFKPNTRLVWLEAPGSITMETPNLPALLKEIKRFSNKIITAIDDTYSSGVLLRPFDLGIDIAMQALTKYAGGHSDLLLGAVTLRPSTSPDLQTRDHDLQQIHESIGTAQRILGLNASPDDCSLVLRGLQTLAVRLEAFEKSTLQIATWCAQHPAIERVLHPAFDSCPGHESFKQLFNGSASIFSFVLKEPATKETVARVVDSLKLFKLGYSWGGTTSVVMAYPDTPRIAALYGDRLIRLGIGLEHPNDLIADLEQALQTI